MLGALLVSALCVCAFGVSNAAAVTFHQCENGTGQTASECEPGVHTTPIVGSHKIKPTLTPTTGTAETHAVLAATIGGIKTKITCTGLTGSGSVENVEGIEGKMSVTGKELIQEFTGCVLVEPGQNCTVPATITTNKSKMESIDNTTTGTMQQKFTPESGEIFTGIVISGCTGGAAILNGTKNVTGTATSEVLAASPTSAEFTSTTGSALKFGGQTATFEMVYHIATADNGKTLALETP
jgi:hypothetical protein